MKYGKLFRSVALLLTSALTIGSAPVQGLAASDSIDEVYVTDNPEGLEADVDQSDLISVPGSVLTEGETEIIAEDTGELSAGAEDGRISIWEEDADFSNDDHDPDGYWHFDSSTGEFRYNKDKNGAIDDFTEFKSEHKDEIKKIVIESGPTKMNEKEKCNFLDNLEEIVYEKPMTLKYNMCFIWKGMYRDCPSLKKVTIGDCEANHGMEIDRDAFKNCTSLSEVKLGTGLWYIGRRVFYNCPALTKLALPDDMVNARGDSFWNCANLKEITLSDKNKYMKVAQNAVYLTNDPFKDKRGKDYLTPCLLVVPEGVVKAGNGSYTVIKGTKDIQWGAFQGDLSLKSVTIASTVKNIQSEAFFGCNNLTSIYLPSGIERIGKLAFSADEGNQEDSKAALNTSITDIYFEGTEDDWKKVKLATYSIDKGYLDKFSISGTTTLYDHLEDAGIPSGVKVHFNEPIKDTDKDLKELIGNTEPEYDMPPVEISTISYNGAGASELRALGVEMELTYTSKLTYCGRKHVRNTAKASAKAINDVSVNAVFRDVKTGKVNSGFEISKVTLKNAKNAATSKAAKPPYLTIQLKAKNLSKEEKKALKEVNKILKKQESARIYFDIDPMDISGFTQDNCNKPRVDGSTGKIKKVGYLCKFTSKGKPGEAWILLKQCKNNDGSQKGDYILSVSQKNITVTGKGNYTGSFSVTAEN